MSTKRSKTRSIPELQFDEESLVDIKERGDEPKRWYLGQGETWNGPFSDGEIIRKIEDGNISWVDFIWTPTASLHWQRICLMDAFKRYLPKPPSPSLIQDIVSTIPGAVIGQKGRKGSRKVEVSKSWRKKKVELDFPVPPLSASGLKRSVWFMQFEGSEFGPLSLIEVQAILRSGKLKGKLFVRREGVLNWMEVHEVPEFSAELAAMNKKVDARADQRPSLKPEAKPEPKSAAPASQPPQPPLPWDDPDDERRGAKRVPLVATVRFNVPGDSTAGSSMYMGVCRDISTHGVLILSNRVPHDTVETILLEVSPLGSTGVEPFSAEVEVVRILSDKKGFSVRFKKLDAAVRSAIHHYLTRHAI